MENQKWIWVDLELTGLDLSKDVIVEIAIIISNRKLENLIYGPNIVINCDETILSQMDPYVVNMHSNSGLLNNIKDSQVTLAQAEEIVLEFLNQNHVSQGILAGNSVHMDRLFLIRHMPRLFEN